MESAALPLCHGCCGMCWRSRSGHGTSRRMPRPEQTRGAPRVERRRWGWHSRRRSRLKCATLRVSPSPCRSTDEAPDTFSRDLPGGQLPVPAARIAPASPIRSSPARAATPSLAMFGCATAARCAWRSDGRARGWSKRVRVYPNLEEAQKMRIYLIRSRQIELEKRLKRQRGHGREFESLREYRAGDEFRDISWSATARRGKADHQGLSNRAQPDRVAGAGRRPPFCARASAG